MRRRLQLEPPIVEDECFAAVFCRMRALREATGLLDLGLELELELDELALGVARDEEEGPGVASAATRVE